MHIVPTFWEKLLNEFEKNSTCIIDFVLAEIRKGEDQLKEWIDENIDSITVFDSSDIQVVNEYRNVIQEVVNNPDYKDIAKNDFADKADSWLIAHAKAYGYIIVTEEVFVRDSKKRVPIPNECIKHGVDYITIVDYLRRTGMKI